MAAPLDELRANNRAMWVVTDAQELAFEDASFDVVTSTIARKPGVGA